MSPLNFALQIRKMPMERLGDSGPESAAESCCNPYYREGLTCSCLWETLGEKVATISGWPDTSTHTGSGRGEGWLGIL